MTIVAMSQVQQHPATVEQQIGRALFDRCMAHFTQVLGQRGLGLSYSSCNAAVAVNLHAQYDQSSLNHGAQQFSAVYGSSRLFSGLDPDFNALHAPSPTRPFSNSLAEEHAEQSSIRTAEYLHLPFWSYNNNYHIYIDLTPCPNCDPWLRNRAENWYVHYFAPLATQSIAVKEKKDARRDEFGRIMEGR